MEVSAKNDVTSDREQNRNEILMEVISGFHRVILVSTSGIQNVRGVEIECRVRAVPLFNDIESVSTLQLNSFDPLMDGN